MAEIHPDAAAASQLAGMQREYGFDDFATMTRAAPAAILGLNDLGRLSPGAVADVVAYQPMEDLEKMFSQPHTVFRRGTPVVREGRFVGGHVDSITHAATPAVSADLPGQLNAADYWCAGFGINHLTIDKDEMEELIGTRVCAAGMRAE